MQLNFAFMFLLTAFLGFGFPVLAAESTFPTTKIGVFQSFYSGEKGQSFSESQSSTGVQITLGNSAEFLMPFVRSSLEQISSRQSFLDSGSLASANFVYYGAKTEIGLYFFPIRRRKTGINIYFGGAGNMGYNYISFDKTNSFQQIPMSDQSFSSGYSGTVGFEMIFVGNQKQNWSFFADATYRNEATELAKQSQYSLNCLSLSAGMSW